MSQAEALPPLGALSLLPPRGAELVVVARPAELLRSQAFRSAVDALAPPEMRDAFARRTGVDPAQVEEAVLAEYAEGLVVLARGPWRAADVVQGALPRMDTVETRADRPFKRLGGWIGNQKLELVAIAEHVVLVSRGTAVPTATIVSVARHGRWPPNARPALSEQDVALLVDESSEAPLVLYVPVPLELPPGFGTSTLLARERAMSASATASGPAALDLTVALRGEFPPGAERNFRTLVESMGASPLGAALGIREAARTLSIQVDDSSAVLTMQLPVSTLARGLRVLFVAEIQELVGAVPDVHN